VPLHAYWLMAALCIMHHQGKWDGSRTLIRTPLSLCRKLMLAAPAGAAATGVPGLLVAGGGGGALLCTDATVADDTGSPACPGSSTRYFQMRQITS
jgi:hypothetical protein